MSELEKALDSLSKKLDSVEHGQGVLCPVKANTLKTISDTLDTSIQEPLDLLQSKAAEVKQLLSNLDAQFVDEQVCKGQFLIEFNFERTSSCFVYYW